MGEKSKGEKLITYTVTIEDTFNASIARNQALYKVVLHDKDLNEKFKETIKNKLFVYSTDEYTEKLDEFIESEGLHINSEEPKVIVDDEGCYRVDVSYTIEN